MHLDFSDIRVAILGDLILDRYLEGSVSRISPEAPVPVLLQDSEHDVLGGAANVASNTSSLGAKTRVIGLVGPDDNGSRLIAALGALNNVDASEVIVDPQRRTTCKTRVVSGSHQFIRIDNEQALPPSAEAAGRLISAIEQAVQWADIFIISDYAKGVCTDELVVRAIFASNAAGKPSIVDPKRKDFSVYKSCSLIKPNLKELFEATGTSCGSDEEVEAAARVLANNLSSNVLVTRSERGMSYVSLQNEVLHLRTSAKEVFDVSGAGDTVLASIALALAAGTPMREAMRLSNLAAGIVVAKRGTSTISIEELQDAVNIESHPSRVSGTVRSVEEVRQARISWQKRGLRVGFTNGCFDLVHPGHISLLRQAAAHCDRLIVGINSDDSVRRLKGDQRPVQTAAARATVLAALRYVDDVVVFEDDTPLALITCLQPDILVKGADYTEEQVVGAALVRSYGGRVLLASLAEGHSTTSMINRGLRRASEH